jgi:anti-sigma regulatory factor (Ser/Thr protein kinase)
MNRATTLVIPSSLKEIPRVSEAIEETMQDCAFSGDDILDMQLAVEEALSNTILHGYCGAEGEVTLSIHGTPEIMQVRIEDCAPPFDPLSISDPDQGSDLEDRQIGGLGIYLMRQVVDEILYEYTGSKNILTLIKRKGS